MPYASIVQRNKIHKLAEQGKISKKVVAKLDKESKGLKLPIRLKPTGKPINVRSIRYAKKRS